MARQKTEFPFEGTLGGLSYYKHPDDGYLVRERSGPSAEQVLTHERFQRTRENASEFKQAIESGKLVRRALRDVLLPVADGKLSSRMNKVMLSIVQSDPESGRGARLARNGNLQLIKDFEFNRKNLVQDVFTAGYVVSSNNNTQVLVSVPGFARSKAIISPAGAKFFRIVSSCITLDFDKGEFSSDIKQSSLLPLTQELFEDIEWQHPAHAGKNLLVAFGIIFYASPEEIPKDVISRRKRSNLRTDKGMAAFTGALRVVWVKRS